MREKTVRQLWGRDFEIVKDGLDESEVTAFVTELVGEREMLEQRQEHLLSLTKLAEKTVAEADKLAEDIKREVEEAAAAKATKILAKAEQEAQEVMEQKRAEIRAAADKEAQAIKANARQEAELLMREHKQRVQELVREGVNRLHTQLLSGLKEVVEQAIALQAEWEKRLAEPIVGSLSPDEGEMTSPSVPVILGQEEEIASPTVTGADSEYKCDILEQLQQTWMDTEVAVPEEPPLATPLESARQPDKGNMDRVAATSGGREPPKTYEGKVELDILPPLVPSQLVEIQNYLRDWPGIGITELRPNNKGYLITVILDKPIQLVDILKQLPEVKDAREHSAEALVGGARSKDSLRRIAITVSGHK